MPIIPLHPSLAIIPDARGVNSLAAVTPTTWPPGAVLGDGLAVTEVNGGNIVSVDWSARK